MKINKTRFVLLAVLALSVMASAMGRKEKKSAGIQTGIKGKVEIWEGNFMPMTDPKSGGGKVTPASDRMVRLYEPVHSGGLAKARQDSISTKLVAEAKCNAAGEFVLEAPPGKYSIFVEEGGGWYFNGFDGEGVQGAVTVEAGKLTDFTIKITTKATF